MSALCGGTEWIMPPIGSKRQSIAQPASQRIPVGNPNFPTKEANERFFAGRAEENAKRPDNLPPSQGGKYTGFGSTSSK